MTVWKAILVAALVPPLLAAGSAFAQPAGAEVVSRYEQVLEQTPATGSAFERVVEIYRQGEGLDALDARWRARRESSREPASRRAAYAVLGALLAERRNQTARARELMGEATRLAPREARPWLARADFERRQGDLPAAIDSLTRALEAGVPTAERAAALRELAGLQQRALRPEDALATWRRLAREFPDDPYALREVADALLAAGQYDDAVATLRRRADLLGESGPARIEALLAVGRVEETRGAIDAARGIYEELLPQTTAASWLNRELRARIEGTFRRRDDLAGLAAYYGRWLVAHPGDVEARLQLAAVLEELGRREESLDALAEAAAHVPDRLDVQALRARRLLAAGRAEEAFQAARDLTERQPGEPLHWRLRGEAAWARSGGQAEADRSEALASWRRLAPEDAPPHAVLECASLLAAHGFDEEALAQYRRALAQSPDAAELRLTLVDFLVDRDRREEAWGVLDGMVQGARATPANYLRLAKARARYGLDEAALEATAAGLALAPRDFDLLWQRQHMLAGRGKWDEALALMPRLVEAAPNDYFAEQVEAAHVQALRRTGRAEAVATELAVRLESAGTPPAPGELSLLVALLDALQRREALDQALEAGARLYPQSVPLARQAFRIRRKQADLERASGALERLLAVDPAREADWLESLVLLHRDAGRMAEAREAARRLVASHPQLARGHELLADLAEAAGERDAHLAHLREAIRLSARPHPLRVKLARALSAYGDTAGAREAYDEAFAASESPADRLALMGPLAEAYDADGRLDELLARLRQREADEEEGWRYAVYLAAVHEHMGDDEAARRELLTARARRPDDPGLLRQLIRLAESGRDDEQALAYREKLVELEPTTARRVGLAEAYVEAGLTEKAWCLLLVERDAFLHNPVAWSRVLPALAAGPHVQDLRDLLNLAANRHRDDLPVRFAVAEFYLTTGAWEDARSDLWDIVALSTRLPPAPAASGAVPSSGHAAALARLNGLTTLARHGADLLRRAGPLSAGPLLRRYYGPNAQVAQGPLSPEAARDRALVYLALLAVEQGREDAFLETLGQKMDALALAPDERLMALRLVGAWQPLWGEIERLLAEPGTNAETLNLAALLAAVVVDPSQAARGKGLARRLGERMAAQEARLDPDQRRQRRAAELYRRLREGAVDRKQGAAEYAAVREVSDLDDARQVNQLLHLAVQLGLWEEVDSLLPVIEKLPAPAAGSLGGARVALPFAANNLLASAAQAEEPPPVADTARRFVRLLRRGWPNHPPALRFNAGGLGGSQAVAAFPPPNRYYDTGDINMLRAVCFGQARPVPRPLIDAVLDELAREQRRLERTGSAAAPYPALARLYVTYWLGDTAAARRLALDLVKRRPEESFQLLAAHLCQVEDRPEEALALLRQVDEGSGGDYIRAQQLMLSMARASGDTALARRAATALAALPLPPYYRQQLIGDLRRLGLREAAERLARGVSGRSANDGESDFMHRLYEAQAQREPSEEAVQLAERALRRDPLALPASGRELRAYQIALEILQRQDRLEDYIARREAELREHPESARLHLALAMAYESFGSEQTVRAEARLPVWLRLEADGDRVTVSRSDDGRAWEAVQAMEVPFGQGARLGITLGGGDPSRPVRAVLDHVSVEALEPGRQPGGNWEFLTILPDNPACHGVLEKGRLELSIQPQSALDGLVFQRPVTGPVRLTARLAEVEGQGWVELSLAPRFWKEASSAALRYTSGGELLGRRLIVGKSLAGYHYERAAALRPGDPSLLGLVARSATQRDDQRAAAAAYLELMRGGHYDVLAFGSANAARALAEGAPADELDAVLGGLPQPGPAAQRYVGNLPWMIQRIGDELIKNGRPADAARMFRRGLEVEDTLGMYRPEAALRLADALLDLGLRDEAASLLADRLLPPQEPEPMLDVGRGAQRSRPPLYQQVSIRHSGTELAVEAGCVAVVAKAADAGLLPMLEKRLQALPEDSYERVMADVLLRIARHDAGFAGLLEPLLEPGSKLTGAPPTRQMRLQALAALDKALAQLWPEQEQTLYPLLRRELEATDSPQSLWSGDVTGLYLHGRAIELAAAMGREDERRELMRGYAHAVRLALLSSRGGYYGAAAVRAVELLVELGDAKGAARLLGLIRFQAQGGVDAKKLEALQELVDRKLGRT